MYATMNKQQLRQACRENGIKNYGRMTVAQMRDELEQAATTSANRTQLTTILRGLQISVAESKKAVQPQKPRKGGVKKIEGNRPTQNGVTRPSAGGKCRRVWDTLDAMEEPTLGNIKKVAKQRRWNMNNTVIEYYQWRKFNSQATA